MNEWEAVGVNVFKKLQRMEPNQALYAESVITKVLRLGLLHSLTPDTDVYTRSQFSQDFSTSVGTLCNSLDTQSTTPMFVNTQQSVGNCTFSNTVPLSTSTFSNTVPLSTLSAITTSSSGFEAVHGSALAVGTTLHPNALSLETPNTIGENQNPVQNSASSVIQSSVISFKTEPL